MTKDLDHKTKIFRAGSFLVTQGQPARCAYMIQKGKVKIYQEYEGLKIDLGEVGSGEIVGDIHVIEIDSSELEQMYHESNPILKMAISCLINRLYKANDRLVK